MFRCFSNEQQNSIEYFGHTTRDAVVQIETIVTCSTNFGNINWWTCTLILKGHAKLETYNSIRKILEGYNEA
jgi:hypothetical protein